MEKPEISIIVPVYNAETTIRKCVESLRTQTFTSIEVLLIDDGSSDSSATICKQYAEKDKRIIYLHQDNSGVSAARNSGIRNASGKYVMFCDSDDYVSNSWCERLYKEIQKPGTGLAVCAFYEKEYNNNSDSEYEVYKCEEIILAWQKGLFLNVCNKIFDAGIIKNNQLFFDTNVSSAEDTLFVIEYLKTLNSREIIYINSALYYYTKTNEDSLSKREGLKTWQIKRCILHGLWVLIDKYHIPPELYRSYYELTGVWNLADVLSKVAKDANIPSILEKKKVTKEIINSLEMYPVFQYGNFDKAVSSKYGRILKTKNSFLITVYNCLSVRKRRTSI